MTNQNLSSSIQSLRIFLITTTPLKLTEKLVSTIKNSAENYIFDELMSKNGDQKILSAIWKKIRQRVRFLKNEYYKQEAENINQLSINHEIEKLFSRAKNQRSTLNPISSSCPKHKILKKSLQPWWPPTNENAGGIYRGKSTWICWTTTFNPDKQPCHRSSAVDWGDSKTLESLKSQ